MSEYAVLSFSFPDIVDVGILQVAHGLTWHLQVYGKEEVVRVSQKVVGTRLAPQDTFPRC